jgi:single-strand DNA-binding protein
LNVWSFSGRVGADAELRSMQSGEKVLSFRVANDVGFGNSKTTQWVDCSFWGKRAEAVANYVKKGDKIAVSGEVKLEEFQRRDGTPGAKLAVRVNDLDLASRQDSDSRESPGPSKSGSDQRRAGGGTRGGSGGGGGGRDYDGDRPNRSVGRSSGGGRDPDDDLDDTIPF